MYQESDPLLPKDEPAPEIHGSRAQSIDDVAGHEDQLVDDNNAAQARKGVGDLVALFTGFVIIALLALMLFPEGARKIGDIIDPTPRTIDQRVTKILKDTPLIGTFILFKVSHIK